MNFKVVGVGEVLWDLLPSGPQLGGAPANFAYHARQLGAQAAVISRVGNDDPGRRILRQFSEVGIGGGAMQIDDRLPTGTARVELGTDGVPNFVLDGEAAWDFAAFTDEAQKVVTEADAICFGSLAQRNVHAASTIRRLVAAAPTDALKIFDVNLRQSYYNRRLIEQSLEMANVLKLNEQELAVLAEMFQLAGSESRQLQQLSNRFNLRVVALTRGGSGSMLYQSGTWSDMPGATVDVADTVGAGDSFSAGLAMGLLHSMSLEQVHRIASEMANFVCSHAGAMPKLPKDICARFLPDYFNV